MQEDVLRAFSHIRGLGCALAAGGLALSLAHADDKPAAPPGYRMVPVKLGGRTAYVQVKDTQNMYSNVHQSGGDPRHPENFSFNTTSSMANMTYVPDTASSRVNGAYQDKVQSEFLTKSYFPDRKNGADQTVPGLDSAAPVAAAQGYDRSAGYDKTFESARSADEQNKTADFASTTASEAGRTALLGGHDVKKFAYVDEGKTYAGPEADTVKRDLDRMNNGLMTMKDLPDRPLTIDEVRALINHGVQPDLKEKPPEPTKPLNAPDYAPDAAPLRSPNDRINLKDDDDVPAPGTMAQPPAVPPENSEQLPQ